MELKGELTGKEKATRRKERKMTIMSHSAGHLNKSGLNRASLTESARGKTKSFPHSAPFSGSVTRQVINLIITIHGNFQVCFCFTLKIVLLGCFVFHVF